MRSLGGTEDTFLDTYPADNAMRVSDLLEAIQGKYGWRRKSRNGMPEQRYTDSSHSQEPTTIPASFIDSENTDEHM